MRFVLGVFGKPAPSALPFAQAALKAGHTITQVFFYGDGTFCASPVWHSIKASLLLCSTSAYTRGITEETLAPGFQLAGLGQFMQGLLETDRYMIFGN